MEWAKWSYGPKLAQAGNCEDRMWVSWEYSNNPSCQQLLHVAKVTALMGLSPIIREQNPMVLSTVPNMTLIHDFCDFFNYDCKNDTGTAAPCDHGQKYPWLKLRLWLANYILLTVSKSLRVLIFASGTIFCQRWPCFMIFVIFFITSVKTLPAPRPPVTTTKNTHEWNFVCD
jgi:hypothetical protein